MAPGPGARLGPYEILSRLGVDACTERWRARDRRHGTTVEVQFLRTELRARPEWRAAFDRAAQTGLRLDHASICPVRSVGREKGVDFLVLDHLAGETLDQRLEKWSLPLDLALRIALDIAGALNAAHRVGVVHGNLDSRKVVLKHDRARVLGFGFPRTALEPGQVAGVPSDLHSLGAILREMDASELERVIERCLAEDPSDRWSSAREVLEELQAILRSREMSVAKTQAFARTRLRRELAAWAIAGGTLLTSLTASLSAPRAPGNRPTTAPDPDPTLLSEAPVLPAIAAGEEPGLGTQGVQGHGMGE